MELIILPLFFPLLLVGWVIEDPERVARRAERRRLEAYARTWVPLHGSTDELLALAPKRRA